MANKNLSNAKNAKNDEFYTQYADIQAEVNAYLDYNPDTFRDKTVLLPCDDPEWSNFTRFFAQNFQRFGLKKLISTSFAAASKKIGELGMGNGEWYQPTLFEEESPQFDKKKTKVRGKIFVLDHDANKNGKIDIEDLEWKYLEGDGDFRSEEVKRLRDEADIIVTNPPFSLFREFLAWILEGRDLTAKNTKVAKKNEKGLGVSSQELEVSGEKKFLVIGNMNAITYKEVFLLIKDNKMWLGESIHSGDREFGVPKEYPLNAAGWRIDEEGNHYIRVKGVRWFTNLEHGRRHQPLQLMTMADNIKFSRHKDLRGKEYQKYDNYDAIEVPFTDAIPSDYDGVMGVPISFLDKYCPEQFEILGITKTWFGAASKIYPEQIEVNKKGEQKRVTKLNDGATLKLEAPPTGETHYIIDGNVYTQLYARILIRHRRDKL
jgi:hypothetical protein